MGNIKTNQGNTKTFPENQISEIDIMIGDIGNISKAIHFFSSNEDNIDNPDEIIYSLSRVICEKIQKYNDNPLM